MSNSSELTQIRLPVTFHRTFVPERHYLSALLRFASQDREGTNQEISLETGIPTGESDGKVPAVLSYAQGMGLIKIARGAKGGSKKPTLTPFGRAVFLEDLHLSEYISQLLIHLHLCRKYGGAEVWHLTFGPGYDILGPRFTQESLEHYLSGLCGKRNRSLIGPLVRTYEEPAALKKVGALKTEGNEIVRTSSPVLKEFRLGYASFFLSIWEAHFPNDQQVTLTDFEYQTYWQRINGWTEHQTETVIQYLQELRIIDVDKQIKPWVLTRLAEAETYWRIFFREIS